MNKKLAYKFMFIFELSVIISFSTIFILSFIGTVDFFNSHLNDLKIIKANNFANELAQYFLLVFGLIEAVVLFGAVSFGMKMYHDIKEYRLLPDVSSKEESK